MAGFLRATWKYVLLPIIAAFVVFNLLQTPKYSGSIEILSQKYNPITIKRDKNGIPSIESKTLKDTMFGLGYAQAQDRLWNIHSRKLLVSGRLSELAGEKALVVDKFFRNIALRRYCEYAIEYIDQETMELFQAYADGVNNYVASAKILPLEFWITWQSFEQFTVVDSLASAKFIAFFLTFDFQFEFMIDTLEEVLGKERAAEILPYQGEKHLWNDVVVLNDDELKQANLYEKFQENNSYSSVPGSELPEERRPPKVARAAAAKEAVKPAQPAASEPVKTQPKAQPETAQKAPEQKAKVEPEKPKEQPKVQPQEKKAASPEPETINLKMPEAQIGSNSWVIHGSLTDTGKPILANDPHLMNSVPTVWYQASIFYEDNKFASGVGTVGFPGIHIGRNNHVSWGITTLLSDTSDLFTLQIKDNKYLYEGEWIPLREYQEKIYVKGRKEPVEITIYETHHGVVLDYYYADIFLTRNFKPKEGQRYALAWSGYVKQDDAYKSFFSMVRAKNVHHVLDAWKTAAEPAFSLVFASEEDIGFVGLGRIPIRKTPRHGVKPRDGSLAENDWLGWIPWESQPKIINPKKGFIVSANNKMASDNIKYGTSSNMFPTSRAARIDEMIRDLVKRNKKISVEDVMTMQKDTLDIAARDATPILVDLTRQAIRKGYATQIDHQILHAMLNKLSTWDYMTSKESIPATIFNVWERYLMRKMIQKVGLKPDDITLMTVNAKFEHFFFRTIIEWKDGITRNHDFWCFNNENEGKADPCLYNLAKSLEESWTFLDKKLGGDMEDWEWSNLHSMDYPHSTFSATPLKTAFHRSVPSQGNGRTVNVARMKLETDSYAGVWSANLKMVISMRPGDKNYYIVDTGISENVLSQHYDDQLHLVSDGQYLEMTVDRRSDWKTALYLNPKSK